MGLATGLAIGRMVGSSSKNACITPVIDAHNYDFLVQQAISASSGNSLWIWGGICLVLASITEILALRFFADEDPAMALASGFFAFLFGCVSYFCLSTAHGNSELVKMKAEGYVNATPRQIIELQKQSQEC